MMSRTIRLTPNRIPPITEDNKGAHSKNGKIREAENG